MIAHKVLIVEDEDWIAEDLNQTLTDNGFQVTDVVNSFERALLSLRKNKPDLVLLDIRLSGEGTGVDIAKEINDRYKVPFLFLSSHIDPKTMKDVLDESPHSILSKPCKPTDLIASVKLALSKENVEISSEKSSMSDETFFVKSEHAYQKINIADLLYIKGEGSYTKLQMRDERIVLRATLKDFEFLSDFDQVMRVHRSYIVNKNFIDKIHSKYIEMGDFEIPVTKEGREMLLEKMNTVR